MLPLADYVPGHQVASDASGERYTMNLTMDGSD